jgi:hypothetical protein
MGDLNARTMYPTRAINLEAIQEECQGKGPSIGQDPHPFPQTKCSGSVIDGC